MNINYKYNNDFIDFNEVKNILSLAFEGRKFKDVENIKKAFLNSSHVIYAFLDEKLIGFARAISDSNWSIIYNVAVKPNYQGYGVGKELVKRLIESLGNRHIFTFTHPKTISFYEHLGFVRSKMAFKYVKNTDENRIKFQQEVGFFLKDDFRFDREKDKVEKNNFNKEKDIKYFTDLKKASFKQINDLLENAFHDKRDENVTKADFEKSQFYELAFDNDKLVGIARLLTDGVNEALLLNVAVDEKYRGLGIGKEIVNRLCEQAKGYDIFLHTHPGAVNFYNHSKEYKRYKTAFAYVKDDEYNDKFFLPKGYRYTDEVNNEIINSYKIKKEGLKNGN